MVAIDLGSNTIRILKYDCEKKKSLAEYEKIVRTAQNLHIDKTIDEASIIRIISAINEAKEKIDFDDVIVAVTTEAIRQAKNSTYVIEKIFNETGVMFEIISGDNEARLVLNAIKNAMDRINIKSDDFVLVDIGGGSTEVIFNNSESYISKSFKVGIVTFTTKYKDKSIEELSKCIQAELKDLKEYVQEYYKNSSVSSFISTAGTPTTVSAIKNGMTYNTYNAELINGSSINIEDLDTSLDLLLSLDKEKKEELVGVNRDDLIISGILILKEIFKILKFENSIVIDDGLREGVAIDYCQKILKID